MTTATPIPAKQFTTVDGYGEKTMAGCIAKGASPCGIRAAVTAC